MGGPGGGGGQVGAPSNRRRTERHSHRGGGGGGGEDNVLSPSQLSNKEKSSTTSIDVIPEDHQFQPSCSTPSAERGGVAVPSEEGSHYTKGGEWGLGIPGLSRPIN